MDYLRRVGEVHGGYTDMSYELDDAIVKECNDAIQWAQDTGRNNLGTLCAVLRVMNKHGKLA
jgi:hypothetical protein